MAQTSDTQINDMLRVIDRSIKTSLGSDILAIIVEMILCKKCSAPLHGCPRCTEDNTRQVCLQCHSATCVNCDNAICYDHTVPKVYPFICQGECYHKRGPSWGWFRKLEELPNVDLLCSFGTIESQQQPRRRRSRRNSRRGQRSRQRLSPLATEFDSKFCDLQPKWSLY